MIGCAGRLKLSEKLYSTLPSCISSLSLLTGWVMWRSTHVMELEDQGRVEVSLVAPDCTGVQYPLAPRCRNTHRRSQRRRKQDLSTDRQP